MIHRIVGAVMILAGCTAAGYLFAHHIKREVLGLKSLISILEYWTSELSFHMSALPELCRCAAAIDNTIVGDFFHSVADKLEEQTESDAKRCITAVLENYPDFPLLAKELIVDLSKSLGVFDLTGQIREINSILTDANRQYEKQINNQELRSRNYKTLGICAGAAIVILII